VPGCFLLAAAQMVCWSLADTAPVAGIDRTALCNAALLLTSIVLCCSAFDALQATVPALLSSKVSPLSAAQLCAPQYDQQ
jgi:hypothetical protein